MATIIRRGETQERPAGEAVRPAVYTFSDMAVQGDAYVRAVRAEAVKVVQQANAEAEAIRQRAEKLGRAAAQTQIEQLLSERVREQLEGVRPALEAAVAGLERSRGEWLDHWESSVVRLAVAIAERIVRRELAADPTITLAWAREALELAAGSPEVTVLLHPTDHERVGAHVAAIAESLGRVARPRVVADPATPPGGCRVETRHGSVDMGLAAQLDRLAEEIA